MMVVVGGVQRRVAYTGSATDRRLHVTINKDQPEKDLYEDDVVLSVDGGCT